MQVRSPLMNPFTTAPEYTSVTDSSQARDILGQLKDADYNPFTFLSYPLEPEDRAVTLAGWDILCHSPLRAYRAASPPAIFPNTAPAIRPEPPG